MKLKSLEQIRNETKHIPREEVFHIIKKYLELNTIRLTSLFGVKDLAKSNRRALNDKYDVLIIDLEYLKQLPEDIILRNLDFCLNFPQNREELAKCNCALNYLCVEPENALATHREFKDANDDKKIPYYDLMYNFVALKRLIQDYINFGFIDKDEEDNLNRKELLISYDKLVASGEMDMHDKYMREYAESRATIY